ncbi:MAG: hypothetical protein JJ896_03840 [Rhodothermales bacterium]|nr:hypothetical protein [Rhodothermales bacterium]MBO6778767.1 hypothetical protein [Rhodothermales bacterium]
MIARLFVLSLAMGSLAVSTSAQEWPVPDSADVSTLDGIMRAYYEVVSGAAGSARDWDRDKSLHIPGALVVITGAVGDSVAIRPVTISEWHERSGPVQQNGFFEYEIARQVRQHGSTVHVWSTYEWKSTPDGPVGGQGINSIEMVWDGERFWITSWGFDGRGTPVPLEYLPQKPAGGL